MMKCQTHLSNSPEPIDTNNSNERVGKRLPQTSKSFSKPLFGISNCKMGDRYNIHSQLEHLQSKYIGTGHADTTKYEWLTNQHRDSLASYLGHYDLLSYYSIAENEAKARVRFNLLEKMLQPCGPPPEKPEE